MDIAATVGPERLRESMADLADLRAALQRAVTILIMAEGQR